MSATLRSTSAYAAHTLAILSLLAYLPILATAQNLAEMTYQGCFSSSQPLNNQGSYIYQTSGYCQPICVEQDKAVLGLSGGSDCWCGDQLPAEDDLVDDSNCNEGCNGYKQENCGGNGFYSVYLTGTTGDVSSFSGGSSGSGNNDDDNDSDSSNSNSNSDSDSNASSSSDSTPSSTVTSTRATTPAADRTEPSVITSVAPGTTVVVTRPAAADATPPLTTTTPSSEESNNDSSETNVAGIAAGVVVGVVVIALIAVGAWFFIRRRRKQQAEQEYNRSNQVSDFMAGGGPGMRENRPPATGYSQMSDQRLDPEVGRRNSVGSIADNEDYSRRILRVANPDRG